MATPGLDGGWAAQRVTNRGAKVLEVTVGDGISQLAEGSSACACQATCHDPGVLRVAGGNRGSKLGSGGSARASRVSDRGIAARKCMCDSGPEMRIGGRSELETDNVKRTRDEGITGTETRSGTSGGGEKEQGLGVTTCGRRGSYRNRGDQGHDIW